MNFRMIAFSSAMMIAASGASAGETADFETVDADASGAVTLAELQQAAPEATAADFAAADADKSGDVSAAEYEAWAASA
jgi:hypothetical protein